MYSVTIDTQSMAKYCKGCGQEIHPMRVKILPNTQTCVECSQTGMKRGIPVLHGNVEKDDTWVDMVFLEQDEFEAYEQSSGKMKKINKSAAKAEMQNYDNDDSTPSVPSFDEE